MVSDVVRTLEAKGFICRNKNPLDKREILLSPTEEGSNKIKIALPIIRMPNFLNLFRINNIALTRNYSHC